MKDSEVSTLADMANMEHFNLVLDNLLVPRVVGSPNHEAVKQYLMSTMKDLGWKVETDKFQENVPIFGKLTFENIVAKANPNAARYLALACHYDSKYFSYGNFVGATDSAVPCAMMVNLAFQLKEMLMNSPKKEDLSLMFIFFDGEEAFKTWNSKDSLYGARHLARKWEGTKYPYRSSDASNYLDSLDMIVLLDLLGSPDPKFFSFFKETEKWYTSLISSEDKLAKLGKFKGYTYGRPSQRYFQSRSLNSGIEDDHIPFLRRGVPIIHVIPYPFPEVWHQMADDKNSISFSTVENLNKILRVFVAQYLGLQP